MKHALLLGRLLNQPHLVHPGYLSTVCGVLQQRGASLEIDLEQFGAVDLKHKPTRINQKCFATGQGQSLLTVDMDAQVENTDGEDEEEIAAPLGIAMVPVMGSLAHRGGSLNADSSVMRGYNNIKNDVYGALQADDIGGVGLIFDTPGGALSGCFETARSLREMSAEFGKPIRAFVDESAYSAGYALASACDKIITTHSGGVASIGVVTTHASFEKQLEQDGVEVTFIHGGARKVDGNPYASLPPDVKNRIQSEIDYHYKDFVNLVAEFRELSAAEIRDTEADVFTAEKALELGLVDEISGIDNALFDFVSTINNTSQETFTQSENSKDDSETTEGAEMKTDKTSGQSSGASQVHDRYEKIMAHPTALLDPKTALDLAKTDSVPVELALSILDRHKPEGAAAPEPPATSGNNTNGNAGATPPAQPAAANGNILAAVMAAIGQNGVDLIPTETGDTAPKTEKEIEDEFIESNLKEFSNFSGVEVTELN